MKVPYTRHQAAVAAVMASHGYQLVEMLEARGGRGGAASGARPNWSGRTSWSAVGRAEVLGQSSMDSNIEDIAREIASRNPCGREVLVKKFKVRVDNQMFYVEVEEIAGEEGMSAPAAAPKAAPKAAAAPAPAPAAAPKAAAPAPAPAAGGGDGVKAPMPGTVLDVKVEVGQQVKAGDCVLILEAMKMENEIAANCDGTVKEIRCKKGQAVNAGEVLVVIG